LFDWGREEIWRVFESMLVIVIFIEKYIKIFFLIFKYYFLHPHVLRVFRSPVAFCFCSSSLYYLCSCVRVFVCGLWSSVLCVLSVSPLCPVVSVFPGFFSFVRPLCVCLFFPCFFFPSSSPVRSSWCVLCVSFPCCVLFVGFLCSFSSSGSLGFLSVPWSSSSSSLVRPPPSSWRPFFLWLYS